MLAPYALVPGGGFRKSGEKYGFLTVKQRVCMAAACLAGRVNHPLFGILNSSYVYLILFELRNGYMKQTD